MFLSVYIRFSNKCMVSPKRNNLKHLFKKIESIVYYHSKSCNKVYGNKVMQSSF